MGRRKAVKVAEEHLDSDTELVSDNDHHVLICNSKQTFGLIFKRGYIELRERTFFEQDTLVGVGEKTTLHKAGEFGPWRLSARPYPARWDIALNYIAEWIAQDNLAEAEDLNYIIEVLGETKKDIVSAVQNSVDQYLAAIKQTVA